MIFCSQDIIKQFEVNLANIFSCSNPDEKYAIAISGGGDSMALAILLANSMHKEELKNRVIGLHFNHGLRAEADKEQIWIENQLKKLGIETISKKWAEKPKGNIQQAARNARYEFFSKSCKKHNLNGVLVAHNSDDIAETFLMRLGKGSGIKGLSAMQSDLVIKNVRVMRPLLNISRADLRSYLNDNNQEWLEDSSNQNEKYLRVRVRNAKQSLADLGLEFSSIIASANSLRRAEETLSLLAKQKFLQYFESSKNNSDKCLLDCEFLNESLEIRLRILEQVILAMTNTSLPPRTSKCLSALEKMGAGKALTIGGLIIKLSGETFKISLEVK